MSKAGHGFRNAIQKMGGSVRFNLPCVAYLFLLFHDRSAFAALIKAAFTLKF